MIIILSLKRYSAKRRKRVFGPLIVSSHARNADGAIVTLDSHLRYIEHYNLSVCTKTNALFCLAGDPRRIQISENGMLPVRVQEAPASGYQNARSKMAGTKEDRWQGAWKGDRIFLSSSSLGWACPLRFQSGPSPQPTLNQHFNFRRS